MSGPVGNPEGRFSDDAAHLITAFNFRSLQKLKAALPRTPQKRAAVLSAYMDAKRVHSSPAVKHMHKTGAVQSSSLEKSCVDDVKVVLDNMKMKRDNETRTAVNILKSAVNGERVRKNKCVTELSQRLGLNRNAVSGGKRIRTTILKSTKSVLDYTKRKTRRDSLDEDTKKLAFVFWLQSDISRPTKNKNDIKRVRLGPKLYSSHVCHVLEKNSE